MEIPGIRIFPTQEEDVRARWGSVEMYGGTHYIWVYLSAKRRGIWAKTRIIIKKWLQRVASEEPLDYK